MKSVRYATAVAALAAMVGFAISGSAAAAAPDGGEARLIETIKSGTKPEKAIACKQLAVYGSPNAVPALADLLLDKEMSSWARIALEAIPGPAADDALRNAMGKAQGRLLAGLINSVGFRRDAKAVDALASKLADPDPEVAGAAGGSLGKIGGEAAARVLTPALSGGTPQSRAAAGEGAILCAEGLLKAGQKDAAAKLYDDVRKADVPKQRVLEATRGAILARGPDGVALMLEQLRSPDRAFLRIGLRAAREYPGNDLTNILVTEMDKTTLDRQALLLAVLADRGDKAALPAVMQATKAGAADVRIAALSALEQLGDASAIGALVDAAADANADVSNTAKTTLGRLQGKDVEAELLNRLQTAQGPARRVLIELAAARRIEGSFPAILKGAQDPDAGVRAMAVETIGLMGDDKQAADLVGLIQKAENAQERAAIEKALMTLTGRCGAACVPHLAPLVRNPDPALKTVALHGLAGAGGPDALAAVKAALDDKDEATADEAVRTLSTWPNRWPDDAAAAESLLSIVKDPKKPAHRVLALRGYFQYVQGTRKTNDAQRLERVNAVLPLVTRPEDKRLAISALGSVGTAGVLQPLLTLAADPAVADEAYAAIVNAASKGNRGLNRQQRRTALQTVIEKTKNETVKKRAEEALKDVK